jgi:hypothetical protein
MMALMLLLWLSGVDAVDATGTWTLHLDPDFSGHQADVNCRFKQERRTLTGICGDEAPLTGEVDQHHLRWTIEMGAKEERTTATFTAQIDDHGQTMTGAWELSGRRGKFTGQKR